MIFSNWYKKQKKEKERKLRIKAAKKILIGTAAGSLSGLLGGLLFSPKSGKETREDIARSSKELTRTINNKVSDAKDSVTDAKIKIKQKSADLKESLNSKVSDAKDSVTDAKFKVSQYLNEKKTSKVISETKDDMTITDNEDLDTVVGQPVIVENETKK
ncbi:YtxH domain-containing protein [Clostridium sp. CF011]|uniref:YtxH domain-containing protein n=1 Tax=unclassified Clostridium TaxID=2614128 RepID=UPI001C0AB575|nr:MULTISPECIES: YtxH domain-containing protein [unclassified Clostridium]MBU3090957.1 YtxH domain-containing protein [Clostridium sp. CF011]MBW9144477.1 YtxH domain-containing protein [Clostridium sp. CM027]UVE40750.1 YtxH domain-containing protein [Clostridium sp. CM027]WAG69721.1 YtxH domain-containing protein [Clostridium sp. CF011]